MRIQDYRGGNYIARQRAAAYLIDAGQQPDLALAIEQVCSSVHHSAVGTKNRRRRAQLLVDVGTDLEFPDAAATGKYAGA